MAVKEECSVDESKNIGGGRALLMGISEEELGRLEAMMSNRVNIDSRTGMTGESGPVDADTIAEYLEYDGRLMDEGGRGER